MCDRVVQFIVKRDKTRRFAFAPLKGETAAKVLETQPLEAKERDSIVLVENYQTPEQHLSWWSQAVFRIFSYLDGGWKMIGSLHYLPPFLFNWAYRIVARYRKKLFPPPEGCMIPSKSDRARFLP